MIKSLGEVAKAVDPGESHFVRSEFRVLGLGKQGSRDSEGLRLQGQLVLSAMTHQDRARLCGVACPTGAPGGLREAGSGRRR